MLWLKMIYINHFLAQLPMPTSTFDSILDAIETLSLDEQASLLTIIHRRLSDRRRAEIAANIAQGRQDYQSSNVFRGTVEEAIEELNR